MGVSIQCKHFKSFVKLDILTIWNLNWIKSIFTGAKVNLIFIVQLVSRKSFSQLLVYWGIDRCIYIQSAVRTLFEGRSVSKIEYRVRVNQVVLIDLCPVLKRNWKLKWNFHLGWSGASRLTGLNKPFWSAGS